MAATMPDHRLRECRRIAAQEACDLGKGGDAPMGRVPGDLRAREAWPATMRHGQYIGGGEIVGKGDGIEELRECEALLLRTLLSRQGLDERGIAENPRVSVAVVECREFFR